MFPGHCVCTVICLILEKLLVMRKILYMVAMTVAVVCAAACGRQQKADPVAVVREHIRLMEEANTTAKRNAEKAWAADSLDMRLMEDDKLRTQFLHAWVELYRRSTGVDFPEKVTDAAKYLLSRTALEAPRQIGPVVRTMCRYLSALNETGAAAAIAAYPHGFDISPGEHSEIARRLLGATLLPGQRAPAIDGAGPMPSSPPSATLLLFYESGCHNCGPLIDELVSLYDILQSQEVRVISVSSDTDAQIYEQYAAQFPWPDKICDFRSFAGPNFKSYWVASTPTMWLIDGRGMVVGQYRSLEETGLLN